jgi:hypothetical protein
MRPTTHRVAEARSLALHREVARRLLEDPQVLDERARARVRAWSRDDNLSQHWVEAWATVLSGSLDEVVAAITDTSEEGRALRQSTPFAGAIDACTRWAILRQVRDSTELE